ncbi:hypothetical protein MTR_5g092390 [Medicago truncatula]|uniref:TIR domain-containing protein n=1 Tax=Medicago truncatula TaxID=3880 RepID=G7K8H0_MEDTR|nr:hypothetical protein MTR_5g092390 [Medicago truncatula]
MDDKGLDGGNQVSLTLLKEIEQSRLFNCFFWVNYGYSKWCLDKLKDYEVQEDQEPTGSANTW